MPDYRTIDVVKVLNGRAFEESSRTQPLYKMPWSSLFPSSVTAGVVGIAEGLLKSAVDYQRDRVSAVGVAQATDPHTRATIGEAAAEIRGSRAQLLYNVGELYDAVRAGHDVTLEQRVACPARPGARRVAGGRGCRQAVYAICGGNSIRLDNPVQRFWRSMHAGLHHGIVVRGHIYDAAGGMLWGEPPTGPAAHDDLSPPWTITTPTSPPTPRAVPSPHPNGELHYHEAGEGPPLVLLHGSGPGVSAWANFGDTLAGLRGPLPCPRSRPSRASGGRTTTSSRHRSTVPPP